MGNGFKLWLRASRVLLVGLRGLGAEVAKNLILAGVRGVTLLDHRQVSQDDCGSQFLIPFPFQLSQEDRGSQFLIPFPFQVSQDAIHAQFLIPFPFQVSQDCGSQFLIPFPLQVSQDDCGSQFLIPFPFQVSPDDCGSQFLIPFPPQVSQDDPCSQFLIPFPFQVSPDDCGSQFLIPFPFQVSPDDCGSQFLIPFPPQVCLTCCSRESMVRINQICHQSGVKFFTGDVFGYHGFMFADLGHHEFVEEKPKVAKGSPGVEDGPEAKRARLDPPETTRMVKKSVSWGSVGDPSVPIPPVIPIFPIFPPVLLTFRSEQGRDPCPGSGSEDSERLLRLRREVLEALGVGPQLLPEHFH
ncbi:SUMO-activating enzyme subunit 1, partial [Manacus vitellinus]|uniref:SUMO-activating enzyme subunit 1 n=1 Tax=Manacus vitellinus TaxID=328815 RepID=UPI00115E9D7C